MQIKIRQVWSISAILSFINKILLCNKYWKFIVSHINNLDIVQCNYSLNFCLLITKSSIVIFLLKWYYRTNFSFPENKWTAAGAAPKFLYRTPLVEGTWWEYSWKAGARWSVLIPNLHFMCMNPNEIACLFWVEVVIQRWLQMVEKAHTDGNCDHVSWTLPIPLYSTSPLQKKKKPPKIHTLMLFGETTTWEPSQYIGHRH